MKAQNNCVLEEHKNMNLPGICVNLPGISEKDRFDIQHFAVKEQVDIVSGSFVRTPENVLALRECLGEAGSHIKVHAKIESVEGLQNLEAILEVTDGVHVSRGDLGMELPLSKLCVAQKLVIALANSKGVPVVVSTQTLHSMMENPRPTHAECTDIANAVLDGCDCVMLSGETAKGMYPVEAVETLCRIIVQAERCIAYEQIYQDTVSEITTPDNMAILDSMASSAVETAIDLKSKLIVVVSDTGKLAKLGKVDFFQWFSILKERNESFGFA